TIFSRDWSSDVCSSDLLDDEDRAPWLARLAHRLDQAESSGLVLACSALKERYRRALGLEHPRRFLVYLRVPTEELARRLEVRIEIGRASCRDRVQVSGG